MAALLDRSKLARAKALKKERMERILEAGLRAFVRFSYAEVTLDSIRKLANVPEGKPELYFGSREELFLKVLATQSRIWSDGLRARLRRVESPPSSQELASIVSEQMRHPREFLHLRSLLPMVLEHIIDVGAVTLFFSAIDDHIAGCADTLSGVAPRMSPQDSVRLLRLLQAYASSLSDLADPERAIARLSAMESVTRPDFDLDGELHILTLMLVERFSG